MLLRWRGWSGLLVGATTAEIVGRIGRPVSRGHGIGTMLSTLVSSDATMLSRLLAGMATSAVVSGGSTARARIRKGLTPCVAGDALRELDVPSTNHHGVLWDGGADELPWEHSPQAGSFLNQVGQNDVGLGPPREIEEVVQSSTIEAVGSRGPADLVVEVDINGVRHAGNYQHEDVGVLGVDALGLKPGEEE